MLKFKVYQLNYEFRTKPGEDWSASEIVEAINRETSLDTFEIAAFRYEKDARKYIEDSLFAPSIHRVSVGYVINGEAFELIEVSEDDEEDIVNEEIIAKALIYEQ